MLYVRRLQNPKERVMNMERVEVMPIMSAPDYPEEIIMRYQDMVYRIAFTYCQNRTDAEDVAQDVFFRYLSKKPRVNGEEHLKAWFIRVAIV